MERTIVISKIPSDSSYGISLGLAKNPAHNARVPVASVLPNGPADRAGISAGDLVVAINGTPLYRFSESSLRSVLESGQLNSISFTVLEAPNQQQQQQQQISDSSGPSNEPGGMLTMSQSCYNVASSASGSSGVSGVAVSHRRSSAATVVAIDLEVDAEADEEEFAPKITKKTRIYTPERLAVASPSPKVVIKRGYSPVITNASSPDLLSASKISGSSRSLQLAASRSPISSPMYIKEFDEDPLVDVLASGLPGGQTELRQQQQQQPHHHHRRHGGGRSGGGSSSGGGIYATQPRPRLSSKSSTPSAPTTIGAPICGPGDIEDADDDDEAAGFVEQGDIVAVSAASTEAKPARQSRSNSQEAVADRHHFQQRKQQQQRYHPTAIQPTNHNVASTPRVKKLKNVFGESSQSVTIVRQDGLFISEKLTSNFLHNPSTTTVSRLLQKSSANIMKFTFSSVDIDANNSQTPAVKDALLKAGESKHYHNKQQQQQQRQLQRQAFSGSIGVGDRRAQSFEALDSRQAMSSPPPQLIVDSQAAQQQDISAVFSVTVERCPDGKIAVSLPHTFDANLSVEPDSALTVIPVGIGVAKDNSPLPVAVQQQPLAQFSLAIGRECGTSYRRKKLRLITPEWQLSFRHDDDDRCLKALQERLSSVPKLRQLPQAHQQQQHLLLHPATATSGGADDPTGNSPRQTGLKLLRNFGKSLWSAKDGKHQQQQQVPLHIMYNPQQLAPRSPDPSGMSAMSIGSYGLPLHMCPMGPDGVPLLVQLCCRVIECGAIRREGVYRISGNSRNIDALEAELSKPYDAWDPNCELWLEYNVVASVLKRFLLQLPDPLIPAIYYNDFLAIQKLPDHASRMLKLHRLLGVMDEHTDHPQHKCHRRTLQYLVNHLGLVSQQSAYNRMRLYNLAMVFAPSVFGQRTQESMLMHSAHLIALTKSIIKFRDWLFTDWETADQAVPNQLPDDEDEITAAAATLGSVVAAVGDASSPPPSAQQQQQQSTMSDPEADKLRVIEAVRELMLAAKKTSAEAAANVGKQTLADRPNYQERDIDAEIDRRLAENATTDEATTDATDGEKDGLSSYRSDTPDSVASAPDSHQQHRESRLLRDVERLNETVQRLSLETNSSLERLRKERELVTDRLKKAEADYLLADKNRLPSNQRDASSSDSLPDPKPASNEDSSNEDHSEDSDHRLAAAIRDVRTGDRLLAS